MSGYFEVTPSILRSVAGNVGEQAATADRINARAQAADVDTKSWGALGLGLGLYAGYTSMRSSADRSIAEVRSFLQHATSALQSTARDYEEADHAGAQLFSAIRDRMGGGS